MSTRLDQKTQVERDAHRQRQQRHQGIAEEIKALAEEKKNDDQPSEWSDRQTTGLTLSWIVARCVGVQAGVLFSETLLLFRQEVINLCNECH